MALILDHSLLRRSQQNEVAQHLRQATSKHSNESISQELIAATESEALPSHILATWLNITYDVNLTVACLKQQFSRRVRRKAIRSLGKSAMLSKLDDVWSSAGGVRGIMQLLSELSVHDVKQICLEFGSLGSRQRSRSTIHSLITELYTSLHSPANPDRRPLQPQYDLLLPACSEECALRVIRQSAHLVPRSKKLIAAHRESFQRLFMDSLNDTDAELHFDPASLYMTSPAATASGLLTARQLLTQVIQMAAADSKLRPRVSNVSTVRLKSLLKYLCAKQRRNPQSDFLPSIELLIEVLYERKQDDILDILAKSWAAASKPLEPALIKAISGAAKDVVQQNLTRLVRQLPMHCRLRFVELAIRHAKEGGIDINSKSQLAQSSYGWDLRMFVSLKPEDAIALLDRLPPGDVTTGNFVKKYDYSWDAVSTGGEFKDPTPAEELLDDCTSETVLRLVILRGTPAALETAKAKVEEAKKKAMRERDAESRGSAAKQALTIASVSGSLKLFEETLLWARRFDKDSFAIIELYGSDTFNAVAIEMLAALPLATSADERSLETVRESLQRANAILLALLDAACAVVREPGRRAYDWNDKLARIMDVIHVRITSSPAFQKQQTLSDEQMFDLVWRDTLKLYLAYQDILYMPKNKALLDVVSATYNAEDPFFNQSFEIKQEHMTPSLTRFLNEIMLAREEHWKKIRVDDNTDVLTLSPAWPRGLAVHQLLPIGLHKDTNTASLSLLVQRAENVLFMPSELAIAPLPSEPADIKVIECFVDSYEYALKVWLAASRDEADRAERERRAFEHALTLTPRDSPRAVTFWKTLYKIEQPAEDLYEINPLPVDSTGNPTEWNVQPSLMSSSTTDEVRPAAVIDANVSAWEKPSLTNPHPVIPSHTKVGVESSHMSNMWRHKPRFTKEVEKQSAIAAALLFIESSHGSGERLLSTPFPCIENARYPAVYLDSQYLEQQKDVEEGVLRTLRRYATDLPTGLIIKLVDSLLANANAQEDPAACEIAVFGLISVFIKSDRPQLACKYVLRLLLDFPQHSARHRHVLTPGLLRRLPAQDAKIFLSDLFETVRERLQATQTDEETGSAIDEDVDEDYEDVDFDDIESSPEVTNVSPKVKISTTKLIVQQLASTEAIAMSDALSMLKTILATARHVDVRTAIIHDLQVLLLQAQDTQIQGAILNVFEGLVAQAAALDERDVMTDEAWQSVEAGEGELPSIDMVDYSLPSLMTAILEFAKHLKQAKRMDLLAAVKEKVLLPILDASIINQQRWTRLLAIRLGIGIGEHHDIPRMPVHPRYLGQLGQLFPESMPTSFVQLSTGYLHAFTQHNPLIGRITQAVKQSTDSMSTETVKHWHDHWQRATRARELATTISSALALAKLPTSGPYATLQSIQRLWTDCAHQYLHEPLLKRGIAPHVGVISPDISATEELKSIWYEQCRPVLAEFNDYIDTLHNKQRTLSKDAALDLPDELDLRLKLLPYPQLPYHHEHEAKIASFSAAVREVVRSLTESGRPYHHALEKVVTAVASLRQTKYAVEVAVELASIDSIASVMPSLDDWLCLEVACSLLDKSKGQNNDEPNIGKLASTSETGSKLFNLVQQLKASPVQEFRAFAKVAEQHLDVDGVVEVNEDLEAWV